MIIGFIQLLTILLTAAPEIGQNIDKPLDSNVLLYNIFAIVASGIIGWVGSMIKGNQEIKKIKAEAQKSESRYSEGSRLIADQMRGFDLKLVELSFQFLEYKKNSEFKATLMNVMRAKATNIIDYNVDLDLKYKDLMMQISREFEDFALRFYYSDMRGIPHQISPFLRIDMNSRIAKFKSYVEHINKEEKIFEYSTGKKETITFLEFLTGEKKFTISKKSPIINTLNKDVEIKSKLMDIIEVLLVVLEKNGLKPDDVIEKFEGFIGDFFKEFIHVINNWDDIDNYIKKEKKINPKNVWNDFNEISDDNEYVDKLSKERKVKD
jgi:hypothetical protein